MFEMRFAPCGGRDDEQVREPVHVHAVQRRACRPPTSRDSVQAVAARRLVAGTGGRTRCPPRSPEAKIEAVELVVLVRRPTRRSRRCASTPRPSVSTRCTFGRLNACRYSSWKHGRLHSWRYQGLSAGGGVRVRDDVVDARPDLLHLLVVALLVRALERVEVEHLAVRRRCASTRSRMRCAMSVQPSLTRSSSAKPPVWSVAKLTSHSRCQPGPSVANQSASISWLLRSSIDDGVRWNTNSSPASRPSGGMHCTAVAPVPMIPTRWSRELGHRARRVAAGVRVVPAAGVEAVAGERLDARDAGQLRPVQRAGAHRDEPGPELVAAVGADRPSAPRRRPSRPPVTSVESSALLVQPVLRGDALRVGEDLGRRARTSCSAACPVSSSMGR